MRRLVPLLVLLGCTPPPAAPPATPEAPPPAAPHHAHTHTKRPSDTTSAPPKKLLAIDWDHANVATDADALALWHQIAPVGADWEAKLGEIPTDKPVAHGLAAALLREGNFACPAVPRKCTTTGAPVELVEARPDSTLADPCLRRLVALWAIDQLEPPDLPSVRDALRAIVALPPPESQLVAAALALWTDADQDARLAIVDVAWAAGQHELVDATIGVLDEPHLIAAATKHHIDGAVEVLSPVAHRAVYLAAIADEKLGTKQRIAAMTEIAASADPHLATDARAAFIKAAGSLDCAVAASAARWLDGDGDHRWLPKKPHATTDAALMRGLCVLASYEALQNSAEDSLLASYVPRDGLEEVRVTYDVLSDSDPDGDGDPHTEHLVGRVPREEVVLPEVEDLGRALRHCAGTTCSSDDRDYRFTFKTVGGERWLAKLEVDEHPPCSEHGGVAP